MEEYVQANEIVGGTVVLISKGKKFFHKFYSNYGNGNASTGINPYPKDLKAEIDIELLESLNDANQQAIDEVAEKFAEIADKMEKATIAFEKFKDEYVSLIGGSSTFPVAPGFPTAAKSLPGVNEQVVHPPSWEGDKYTSCDINNPSTMQLYNLVQHLNDGHQYSREQIADWLETLDVDLTFKSPEEKPVESENPCADVYLGPAISDQWSQVGTTTAISIGPLSVDSIEWEHSPTSKENEMLKKSYKEAIGVDYISYIGEYTVKKSDFDWKLESE